MKEHHGDLLPNYQSEPPKPMSVGLISFFLLVLAVLIFLAGFMLGYEAASEPPQNNKQGHSQV